MLFNRSIFLLLLQLFTMLLQLFRLPCFHASFLVVFLAPLVFIFLLKIGSLLATPNSKARKTHEKPIRPRSHFVQTANSRPGYSSLRYSLFVKPQYHFCTPCVFLGLERERRALQQGPHRVGALVPGQEEKKTILQPDSDRYTTFVLLRRLLQGT